MSFSSFTLFSFYQQPNTGRQPTALNTGILLSGNNESGKAADFNWYFPYASTNILINSLLSQSRFGYHIWADSYGAVVPGLHYATVSTAFSGSFQANYDSVYFGDKFYGTVYPQMHELFSEHSTWSGRISGAPHDNVSIHNTESGRLTGMKSDTMHFSNVFSGEIKSSADQMYLNNVISGIINKVQDDTFNGHLGTSGSFWGLSNDLCQISFTFSGFAISSGVTVKPFTGQDNETLSFTLTSYQVNS